MKAQTFGRIQPAISLATHFETVLVQPSCQKEKLLGAEKRLMQVAVSQRVAEECFRDIC
jgi:hypothetical protein